MAVLCVYLERKIEMIQELRILRKMAKEAAISRLVKTKFGIYREELGATIYFTTTGIKECINQPFGNFEAKLNLICEGLEGAFRESVYIGFTDKQTHYKPHIIGYHFFETVLEGEKAYFNVQLTVQNDLILYSITEHYSL